MLINASHCIYTCIFENMCHTHTHTHIHTIMFKFRDLPLFNTNRLSVFKSTQHKKLNKKLTHCSKWGGGKRRKRRKNKGEENKEEEEEEEEEEEADY